MRCKFTVFLLNYKTFLLLIVIFSATIVYFF